MTFCTSGPSWLVLGRNLHLLPLLLHFCHSNERPYVLLQANTSKKNVIVDVVRKVSVSLSLGFLTRRELSSGLCLEVVDRLKGIDQLKCLCSLGNGAWECEDKQRLFRQESSNNINKNVTQVLLFF